MSVARTVIVAVVALGLGVALGLVLGGGRAGTDGSGVAGSVDPEPAAAVDENATEERTPSRTPPPERAPRRHVESGIVVSDLVEQAIASIETPEVPTGDGRIEGRATTRAGKPLADVKITASMVAWRQTYARPWNEHSMAEQVTLMVQRRRLQEATTRTTTTDADGRYVLIDLPREPHHVQGASEQYRITHSGQFRPQVEPDATVDMVGDPIVRVPFALTLADGTEPLQAMVTFEGGGGSTMGFGWTPSSRTMDIQPGSYKIVVSTGANKELTATVPSITLVHGEAPEEIQLRLLPQPGIAGRLVPPAGTVTMRAYVGAELVGPDTTPESVAAGRQLASVQQHDGYVFTIPNLAPGRYLLVAWETSSGNRVLASEEVVVRDEQVEVELVAAGPEREDHLEIVARGPEGEVLSGFRVQLRFKGERRSSSLNRPAIAREGGAFWVRHIEASRATGEGTYTAVVSHPSYGHTEREYVPGPSARIEIAFDEPAFVEVTVAGASAELISAGLVISITDDQRRSVSSRTGAVDPEGRIRVGPVQPGGAQLTASINLNRRNMTIATQDVHVRPGENKATFSLPTLHTLRVEWADPAAGTGQGMMLRSTTKGSRVGNIHQTVPDSGRVIFRFVPAGTYELRVGRERRDVTLPGTDLIRF